MLANTDNLISQDEIQTNYIEFRMIEPLLDTQRENVEYLKILFYSAPVAYYLSDLQGHIINGNKAAEALIGYRKEELLGKSFLKIQLLPSNQIPKAAKLLLKNAQGLSTGPDEFTLNKKDGSTVAVEISTHPVKIKNKTVVLGIAMDISERKKAEEAEKKHRFNLTFLNESAMTFLVLPPDWDIYSHVAGTLQRIIEGALVVIFSEFDDIQQTFFIRAIEGIRKGFVGNKEILEQTPLLASNSNTTLPRSIFKALKLTKIDGDFRKLFGEKISKLIESNLGEAAQVDQIYGIGLIRDERIFGNIIILIQHGSPPPDASLIEAYVSQALVALGKRLAEAKTQASLKEKTMLLKEIHHRVKNNLQIISSLLALQSNYIHDQKLKEMFLVSCDRIRSMAFVHEQLYQSDNFTKIDFRQYLNNLIQKLISSYETDMKNIEMLIDVEQIDLAIDTAIPCGLILSELITNAIKYAFPPDFVNKAILTVNLKSTSSDQVELLISDNGIGLPEGLNFAETESLGLKLVNILAQEQLGGKVEVVSNQGTSFKITFNKDMS